MRTFLVILGVGIVVVFAARAAGSSGQASPRGPNPEPTAPKAASSASSSSLRDEARDHYLNAVDYRTSHQYGLALIEIDQAVASAPQSQDFERTRADIRTEATRTVQQARARATTEAANRPKLELLAGYGCRKTSQSYMTYEGQVRNVSGDSLRFVKAVVTYTAADGTFITSDNSYVEYTTLLAGQTSPFKVITRDNPAIARCAVEFQLGSGGTTINTIYP
jgi:hypothetical protein